ncbi:MAG: GTP-binding signal recognition particle G-domain protein [Thermoleophilia bacterium]|nr:GTP-binding signal recognition particle G-domain protein [Thermoleophilia bacterium]
MRIKTFQGRSLEEVLPQIREELGPNAVVVGQRTKVQGGVAGFFGTKVIEVTAADEMPSDEMLVDLEDQFMGNADLDADDDGGDDAAPELAKRFAGAMKMGRVGGLDVTDEWDPSQDAELAQEYGRVLEHAATAGFSELDVPVVARTPIHTQPMTVPQPTAPMQAALAAPVAAPAPAPALDPLAQAHALAERAHQHMQHATARMEQAPAAGTYAPPRALPRDPQVDYTRTFAASVEDTPMQGFVPQAVPALEHAATTVEHALRTDLAMPRSTNHELTEALNAAVDTIDLKAMAALRSVVHATRRSQQAEAATSFDARIQNVIEQLDTELAPITARLTDVGVDQDVIDALVDTAVRHRRPFGGEQDIATLMRSMVEESLSVRTGFADLGRAHRVAFVGAANAGKTTVVTKVAGQYAAAGMRVGIISIVSADPGVSIVADRSFSDLDCDVRYAASSAQAIEAVNAFDEHDLVLVDTPASTYLDSATYQQVQTCLMAIGADDVHVVLPMATSTREASSIVERFRPLGANRMVVSRIDESRWIGEILNLGFRLGLPMTFLSDGPNVTGDLRAASAREIADRILSLS